MERRNPMQVENKTSGKSSSKKNAKYCSLKLEAHPPLGGWVVHYDKHADTEFTPSVFSYASNATEYRVLYFPDKGYARSVRFEGDEGLPYILKKVGWFGNEAEKIFGR